MSLRSEIISQPEVLTRLIDHLADIIYAAEEIRKRKISYVFLAARGTSDNAGLYAKYLWGAVNQLPMALAAPSLFSLYQSPPKLTDSIVVGISQSGQSPDIVSVLEEGKRQNTLTLSITNDIDSPLATAADLVIDIGAGEEKAVAATKTYTAELMAIAMLSAVLNGDRQQIEELRRVPELVKQALELEPEIEGVAERYRDMQHCVVLGRGYNYSTAFEWSLKLKELAYVAAEPYSSADFQHGPIAIVSQGFPVMAVAPRGKVLANMAAQLRALVKDDKAELVTISNDRGVLELAQSPLQLPENMQEWLSPMVTIVPAQLFSYHLARAKGLDTERPRGLTKVTKTE